MLSQDQNYIECELRTFTIHSKTSTFIPFIRKAIFYSESDLVYCEGGMPKFWWKHLEK